MAVYTTLSSAQVSAYLSPFNLGELIELRGISGGIENTNYFVTTQVKAVLDGGARLLLGDLLDVREDEGDRLLGAVANVLRAAKPPAGRRDALEEQPSREGVVAPRRTGSSPRR